MCPLWVLEDSPPLSPAESGICSAVVVLSLRRVVDGLKLPGGIRWQFVLMMS